MAFVTMTKFGAQRDYRSGAQWDSYSYTIPLCPNGGFKYNNRV